MSALTDAATALVTEIAAAVAEIKTEATDISNLTAQLAAAVAANNPAEVSAVTAQLVQGAADLHAAIDAASPPVAPAPVVAPAAPAAPAPAPAPAPAA